MVRLFQDSGDTLLVGNVRIGNLNCLHYFLRHFGEGGAAPFTEYCRGDELQSKEAEHRIKLLVRNQVFETLICAKWICSYRTVTDWRPTAEKNGAGRQHRSRAAVKPC